MIEYKEHQQDKFNVNTYSNMFEIYIYMEMKETLFNDKNCFQLSPLYIEREKVVQNLN